MIPPFLPRTGLVLVFLTALVSPASSGSRVSAQDASVREAYFRAIGEHFDVPLDEVNIIGEWDLQPDEVPVVLFIAQGAGVSSDALIGMRRRGRSWAEVGGRFGLEAQAFRLPLPEGIPLGPLARAAGEFRGRPSQEWSLIRLTDEEIVAYVNLRFLCARVDVAPERVLESWETAGSFMAAYPHLRRR